MTFSPAPPEQSVTASGLVRNFGLWQERAARAPLYILHRGRPRFVLASIETMDALCTRADVGRPAKGGADRDTALLLDGVGDLVVLAEADGTIRAASRTARAHFGVIVRMGAPLAGIAAIETRAFLADAIRRVVTSGAGDLLDVPSAARTGRTLSIAIEPAEGGVALFARDGTTGREYQAALAAMRATDAALLVAGGVARATINLRGYVTDPDDALATLTALDPAALATIRFTALVEIGDRVPLGAAIEAVFSGGTPPATPARLLVNRADPLPVRIGVAPLWRGGVVDGAVAVIAAA